MNMKISDYWDERIVFIYGLLAGYTELSPERIGVVLRQLVNSSEYVVTGLHILSELEKANLVTFPNVIIDLRTYHNQITEEHEGDTASKLMTAYEDAFGYGAYEKEFDVANVTELMDLPNIVNVSLHGCVYFDIHIKSRQKLKSVVADYLSRYKQDQLYTPLTAYLPYRQQEKAVLDWLDTGSTKPKLSRLGLPDRLRLFEAVFTQVAEGKFTISELDSANDVTSPFYALTVSNAVGHHGVRGFGRANQLIDPNLLRVTSSSYDRASYTLNLEGVLIQISTRKKETNEAKFLRHLFSVKYFYDGLPIKKLYPLTEVTSGPKQQKELKKARSLLTAINKKLPEELKGRELIKMDKLKFYISHDYK